MNAFKHMEIVLLFAFGAVCAAAWLRDVPAGAASRTAYAAASSASSVSSISSISSTSSTSSALTVASDANAAAPAAMPVVVVSARRLTAAKKQALAQN